jgi:hypothetical protein
VTEIVLTLICLITSSIALGVLVCMALPTRYWRHTMVICLLALTYAAGVLAWLA